MKRIKQPALRQFYSKTQIDRVLRMRVATDDLVAYWCKHDEFMQRTRRLDEITARQLQPVDALAAD